MWKWRDVTNGAGWWWVRNVIRNYCMKGGRTSHGATRDHANAEQTQNRKIEPTTDEINLGPLSPNGPRGCFRDTCDAQASITQSNGGQSR